MDKQKLRNIYGLKCTLEIKNTLNNRRMKNAIRKIAMIMYCRKDLDKRVMREKHVAWQGSEYTLAWSVKI